METTSASGKGEREARKGRANRAVLIACCAFVGSMVGMAYAAVPLYQMFCQLTGYGGTTKRVEAASATIGAKTVKVRFDANTRAGLPWDFRPLQREVEVRVGETARIAYEAVNNSDRDVVGQATFNVTPLAAGAFFNKVECFCFTETVLKPGERIEMPVVFFVDPAYVEAAELQKIHTLTLSYTFFPRDDVEPVAAVADPAGNEDKDI